MNTPLIKVVPENFTCFHVFEIILEAENGKSNE